MFVFWVWGLDCCGYCSCCAVVDSFGFLCWLCVMVSLCYAGLGWTLLILAGLVGFECVLLCLAIGLLIVLV